MRKLVYYDIKKNKNPLIISSVCIMIALILPISVNSASVLEGSVLLVVSPIVMDILIIASVHLVFHAMFMKRFMKDDILVLSPISRKDIGFEAILFIWVYAFIVSYVVAIMLLSRYYMIQHVCICFTGILVTLSCVLSQWNAMNEHRGENVFISIGSFVILMLYILIIILAPILTWSYEACIYFCIITLLLSVMLNVSFYRRFHKLMN